MAHERSEQEELCLTQLNRLLVYHDALRRFINSDVVNTQPLLNLVIDTS